MKQGISDSLLRNQICEALEQFDEEDFSGLRIEVKSQDVLVKGSFRSHSARERGEALIKKIRGVQNIVDESTIE